MTTEEIMHFCAMNGISILFRKPSFTGEVPGRFELVQEEGLPDGVTSIVDRIHLPNVLEMVFTMGYGNSRLEWHTMLSIGIANDLAAFNHSLRLAFETFRKYAAKSPGTSLWGFPIKTLEEEVAPENWPPYAYKPPKAYIEEVKDCTGEKTIGFINRGTGEWLKDDE